MKSKPLPPVAMEAFRKAMAAHQAGRLVDAETLYRRVLSFDADQFPALVMLGTLYAQQGIFPPAETLFSRALQINPDDADVQFNYGNVLVALGRFDEAFAAFGRALAIKPSLIQAHLNRGNVLIIQKRFEEAIACFDAAIQADPDYAEAYSNRGNAFEELRRLDEALASYDSALARKPRKAEFHASRANVLNRLHRYDEAISALNTAISLQPENAGFHYNVGNILFELKHHVQAHEAYDRAFRLDPKLPYVEGDRFFAKRMICDWAEFSAENQCLVDHVAAGQAAARPFVFLSAEASQTMQTRCANLFADREFPAAQPLWNNQVYDHQRIRVAYVSADFRDHPVSHLLAGVFESHDRSRFETTAVSFGPSDQTPLRRRLEVAFDHFMDVQGSSDAEIARMLRTAEIDIAVDLMGPTQGARPAIFSYRPAPVQTIYLGYAGSSGAPYIDYLIADRVVLPETEQGLFREKIVYLPHCFMGVDSKRAIATESPSRLDEGLPATGFVFCAFSNTYKISPQVFGVWMELLREVEGSTLWLVSTNEDTKKNLRREIQSAGIDAERVVFARRVPLNKDHLARHRLADLFLDTFPLGAHSVVCDALWAGIPTVTCAGSTFGSRVAASALSAVGLTQLITNDLKSYKDLARDLARNPQKVSSLKQRLAAHRETYPLFNTLRFTRHLETAYVSMLERVRRGEPPSAIVVPAIADNS